MNYHAFIAHFPKITNKRHRRLAAFLGNEKSILEIEYQDLIEAGWEQEIAAEFIGWRKDNPPDKVFEAMEKEKIKSTSIFEESYPTLLKEIADPPINIFYRGDLTAASPWPLAVIGTRRFTSYGKNICTDLTTALALRGISIVSGLALGIDAIAHESALSAFGKTVAVLGSGLDDKSIYPAAHQPLARDILKNNGLLISEYPPGFKAQKYSFPARNRLVAGLTLGTLLIEAPEQSGALITTRFALDYNREVMCVPHSLTSPTGIGPNRLIKSGAHLITSAEEILEILNIKTELPKTNQQSTGSIDINEEKILTYLSSEPKNINEIILESDLPSALVSSTLSIMEIKGIVKNLGGLNYTKK